MKNLIAKINTREIVVFFFVLVVSLFISAFSVFMFGVSLTQAYIILCVNVYGLYILVRLEVMHKNQLYIKESVEDIEEEISK